MVEKRESISSLLSLRTRLILPSDSQAVPNVGCSMMPLRSGWKLWGYRWFEFFADIFDFAEYRSSDGFSVQSSAVQSSLDLAFQCMSSSFDWCWIRKGCTGIGVTQTFTGWRGVLQRNAIAVHQKKINRSRLFARNREPHETPLHTIDCRASRFGIAVGPCRCGGDPWPHRNEHRD